MYIFHEHCCRTVISKPFYSKYSYKKYKKFFVFILRQNFIVAHLSVNDLPVSQLAASSYLLLPLTIR